MAGWGEEDRVHGGAILWDAASDTASDTGVDTGSHSLQPRGGGRESVARTPSPQVSGGNGEQVMSRDVHRLCTQFDFFRLLSFYHSGGRRWGWGGGGGASACEDGIVVKRLCLCLACSPLPSLHLHPPPAWP